jgi:hypothetical protein
MRAFHFRTPITRINRGLGGAGKAGDMQELDQTKNAATNCVHSSSSTAR